MEENTTPEVVDVDTNITDEELVDLGGSTVTGIVTDLSEELAGENISLDTQESDISEAETLHNKVIQYADRLNEIISENGEGLVMRTSVTDTKDDVYVGCIDQKDNSVVIIKKGSESFMIKLDGYKDIKHIFIEGDDIIVAAFNHHDQTVIIKLDNSLNTVFQKPIFNHPIEISSMVKWNDQYLLATNVIKTIEEYNLFRQAIIRCNDLFAPIDIIEFDDKIINDFDIPVEGSFTKIECMLPIEDKLFVASIGGNNEKIISNISIIDSDYKVERSSYMNIEGSNMTKIGLLYPTTDNAINVVGIYTQDTDNRSFIKKLDYKLNII